MRRNVEAVTRGRTMAPLAALGVVTLLVGPLAALAYFQMFSTYARYDDEGYMMLTVRHVLAGHRLYDEVWTLYGPVYFFYKWLVHGLGGLPLTHDVVRLTAIAVRLLTAMVAAVTAWRLTRSVALTAVALVLVTVRLARVNSEPGHPQELCAFLAMALVALPAVAGSRWPTRLPIALGLVVAALTMTKVNIGIFAGLAVWMATLSALPATPARLVLRLGSLAALSALPWGLMRSLLERPAAQHFAATETLAIVALATIAFAGKGGSARLRALVVFVSAWMGGVVLVVGAMSVLGTSVAALVDSLLVGPSRMPAMFVMLPLSLFPSARPAAAAVALAIGVRMAASVRVRPAVVGLSQIAVGLAVLLGVCFDGSRLLVSGVTPFVWLVLLPSTGLREDSPDRFVRLVLCWVAVLLPLQAFPVAGSQVWFGTVIHVLVGAVCMADGLGWLRSLGGVPARPGLRAAVSAVALLVLTGAVVADVKWTKDRYDALVPLALPGAARLRQPLAVVQVLQGLSAVLRERADTFLSVPGFSSLYFWAGKEPPTLDVIGHQMRFYSDERQAEMLRALLKFPRPVVVHFRGIAPPYPPLEAELRQRFTPSMQIGLYHILVPRDRVASAAAPP